MIPIQDKGETNLLRMFKGIDIVDRTETFGFLFIDKDNKYWIITPKNTTGFFHADEVEPKSLEQIEWLKPIQSSLKEGSELLPCPFCGKEPEWVNLKHPSGIPALKCFECQFEMQQDRRDKTIFFWNRRASSLTPKSISDSEDMVTREEYEHAINEIGQLQEQLKEAEEEIRDLNTTGNDTW